MSTFKGILELAIFLMSKHLLDDNIATFQIPPLSLSDALQIVNILDKLGCAVHHAPALFKDGSFIADTAVKVRLTYARD
jgi:hypothetical protein